MSQKDQTARIETRIVTPEEIEAHIARARAMRAQVFADTFKSLFKAMGFGAGRKDAPVQAKRAARAA